MARAKTQHEAKAGGGKALPALCNVLGTLMLVAVIAVCVPVTVPYLFGYQVFDVVSGSMEPELPIGSAVFVKSAEPSEITEGEVIAYEAGETVIVHRVMTNRTSLGEFVTKGDANASEDLDPVPYESVVGRMVLHVPVLGAFLTLCSGIAGKIYLLLVAACGVMLNMVASRMRDARRTREIELQLLGLESSGSAAQAGASSQAAAAQREAVTITRQQAADAARAARRRRGNIVRAALIAVLAVVFLGSAGVVGFVSWQYNASDATYRSATDSFATIDDKDDGIKAPIKIDFDALCKKNPDVIGWIYCKGTVINYPVLKGKTNDDYLHHDYTGEYNINGSIFVDAGNADGFLDSNTIIYGHHMNSGSMFAGLVNWEDPNYYKKHPVMWLLTPMQDYKIVLFSAHHVNAYSTMYQIIHEPGEDLAALLGEALVESDIHANAQLDTVLERQAMMKGVDLSQVEVDESNPFVLIDSDSRYVMLSTCAYLFNDDRYVLHGKLVPVDSAGGK